MKRRLWLVLAAGLAAGAGLGFVACGSGGPSDDGPPAGVMPKESFQKIIGPLMTKWNLPGGAVALVKDEKLVMAEGYGYADVAGGVAALPDSLFRIASLSKPVTAAAVLKLVEEGRLGLEDKAFAILSDLQPPAGATVDPRLADITVRDLLQHSGGWDRDASFDPMFRSREIAAAMGVPTPPDAATIIRYMRGQPLDFTPGTKYVYSNFGYAVLGRIIERTTGKSYGSVLTDDVLAAMGITRMRLGRSLKEDQAPGEAVYYDYAGAAQAFSVFTPGLELFRVPMGAFVSKRWTPTAGGSPRPSTSCGS